MEGAPLYNDIAEGPEPAKGYWLRADDGVRLRVGHWAAPQSARRAGGDKSARGTVLLLPGRTEYIEKYGRAAVDLAALGYDTFSIDWRGQGLADRLAPDPMLGHVKRFSDYQRDVHAMIAAARGLDLPRPWFMIAHSMGGCIGLRALHEGLPVRAAVFSGPMWGIRVSAPLRPIAGLYAALLTQLGRGTAYAPTTGPETYVLSAPFEDNVLTGSRRMWEYLVHQARAHPELTIGGPSVRWFHEAQRECRALVAMAPPQLPAACYFGGHERVVDTGAIRRVMGAWQGGSLHEIEGAEHELMMETTPRREAFFQGAAALFSAHSA